MMRVTLTFSIIAMALSQTGATGGCGEVIRDPGFDIWCGDQLCTWKLERGEVARVPTWHEGDSGVELVGADAAIEQLSPVNSSDSTCLEFDLVTNIDETAEVYLNVDVEGDGTLEMHERLPASHWKPLSYLISIKPPFDGVRFEITKAGIGTAVIAQIAATTNGNASACGGLSQLQPSPRPDGGGCLVDADCSSGACVQTAMPGSPNDIYKHCSGCNADTATGCAPADACGIGTAFSPVLGPPLVCVPVATHELGELCATGAECASGTCARSPGTAYGWCSTCDPGAPVPCANGEACGSAWSGPDAMPIAGAFVCSPNAHRRLHGEPCASDDDCASSACAGTTRRQCDDGRACASPDNCPVEADLAPGPCTTVGIQGGTCD